MTWAGIVGVCVWKGDGFCSSIHGILNESDLGDEGKTKIKNDSFILDLRTGS